MLNICLSLQVRWDNLYRTGQFSSLIASPKPYRSILPLNLLALTPLDPAALISNPGFEADTFTNFPGYILGNSPLPDGRRALKPMPD